ncbi:LysR family transcriptional regulator [Pseudomonas sp. NA-150]|uniref:LysR family transcriptional regulator n=1 Tax=Pseudomonas sp. NA-150 TaxID=3367525 RepID=UPI0037CA1F0F
MDRYHEMVVFQAVAESLSLAAAARRLKLSVPTVMRAMAELESRLGVVLLTRSTRGARLTETGTRFVDDCARIIQEVNAAEVRANGMHVQPRGHLSVLMPLPFSREGLAPILVDYLKLFPEVLVYAQYHDRFPNMHEDGLDVAVLIGDLPNSALIAIKVGTVRHAVCASPAYLAAHGEPEQPADIARHHIVHSYFEGGLNEWTFQAQGELRSQRFRPRMSCASIQTAIEAAVHGAGLTRCLSYQLHDYFASGRLRRVLTDYELPSMPVHVVYRGGRKASARVRSFVDFAVAYLRQHPALAQA